ncbi:MAG TPA: hypothetical protein VI248_05260 [Kineosporiaceae bacterium]
MIRETIPNLRRLALLALSPSLGVALIALSYHQSLRSTSAQSGYFLTFWAGIISGAGPLVHRLCSRKVLEGERQLVVAGLALFTFAPKYLRNASGPLFYDERAHWVQLNQVVSGHHLYVANDAVPIVQYYPGLHALSGVIVQATGLSSWTVAEIVVAVVHVLGALAAYMLARTMLPPQGAGIVAAIYMTNAEWIYFDTQFAYESLGVTLVMWVLYFAARTFRARTSRDRTLWAAMVIFVGGLSTVTHHLSTAFLSGILILSVVVLTTAAVVRVVRGGDPHWERIIWLALPALAVSTGLIAYVRLIAPETSEYLGSPVGDVVAQFKSMIMPSSDGQGGRRPFAGSQIPSYERYAAMAAPIVVALLLVWQFVATRAFTRLSGRGLTVVMHWVAVVYVLSIPLVLTIAGSELARRSWAFTYVGVGVVLARLVLAGLHRRAALVGPAAASVLCLLTIGNLAAGQNVPYRFPGPYIFGSDARSVTANMVDAASWWGRIDPDDSSVVVDRYNGVLYQAIPGTRLATPSDGPVLDFYVTQNPPTAPLVRSLADQGFRYLVIDKNLQRWSPMLGSYIAPGELPPGQTVHPVAAKVLERWVNSPYTTRVYDSDQITIYRLDPAYARASWR